MLHRMLPPNWLPFALREDIPESNLTKGSIGRIVAYYPKTEAQEARYSLEGLVPLDTVEVFESHIESIASHLEIQQAG